MPNPARGRRLPGTTEHLDQNNSSCQFPCLALSFVSGVGRVLGSARSRRRSELDAGRSQGALRADRRTARRLSQFAAPFLARMKFVDEQGEGVSPTLSALRVYREHRVFTGIAVSSSTTESSSRARRALRGTTLTPRQPAFAACEGVESRR